MSIHPAPTLGPAALGVAVAALGLCLAGCSAEGQAADQTASPDAPSATSVATGRTSPPPTAVVPAAASSEPTAAASSEPTAAATQVDAAVFKRPSGYYFTSPSGHLHCGQVDDQTGCQSDRLVGNLPKCNRPADGSAPMVALSLTGVRAGCTTGEEFVVTAARVLGVGERVQLGDVTCTSSADGITCADQSGAQFVASEKSFQPG